MFEYYLRLWKLTPDGEPIITRSSRLLPVRREGAPTMLKIAVQDEEKVGGRLMAWWDGDGAARVLEHHDAALLLERAEGMESLSDMVRRGHDAEACRIVCHAVARLHAPRDRPAPSLVPLTRWFQELTPAAAKQGGILSFCAETANQLLASPQEEVVLHGDIHHDNILDFGARGWLAIDPKGLWGERGFDYANLFCNPDRDTASSPGRLAQRAALVAETAGLERTRLLRWVLAWSGLSAAWMLADGMTPGMDLRIAAEAAAELERFPS